MKSLAIVLVVMITVTGMTVGAYAQTAVVEQEQKPIFVGNKICPVSGEHIGTDEGMKPETYQYKGKIYNLCCLGCVSKFNENPEKYTQIAEQEVMSQKAESMDTPVGQKNE